MLVFDSHCDTLYRMVYENLDFSSEKLNINKRNLHDGVQVFAAFSDPQFADPMAEVRKMAAKFREIDLGKTVGILALEGGDPIKSIEDVHTVRSLGIRFVTLTWNFGNLIASGNADSDDLGLSDFGKCVLAEFETLGIVPDVSHASEKTFWNVAEVYKKPFIASHSNSKAVCPHRRNLTDEQFLHIKNTGGMVGINFYPPFLSEDNSADVSTIVKHIEHFLSLGGERAVGIGSDFDGIDSYPENLENGGKYYVLADELLRLNYPEKFVSAIFYENYITFVKNNL